MSDSPTLLHKGRLEALSDGVFAVVLTLLVLDLKLDHLQRHSTNEEVWAALREMGLPLVGYVFSFVLVAVFWVLQDRKFTFLTHTTVRHSAWTFAFLFGISLIPFSVSIYLRAMGSGVASCIYFAAFAFIGAALLGAWFDARRSGLVDPKADPVATHRFSRRLLGMTLAMATGAVVAYFRPSYAGMALILVILITRKMTKPPRPAQPAASAAGQSTLTPSA